ncbi:MAG: hypothetical protein FD146_1072 [Anaerolineaceae bacterium]|nr:MAG: hypothetical protein FD146_1072 [Anaerolineaceae bacterium]
MTPFLEAGKPVFAIEYTDMGVDFAAACAEAKSLGMGMILKHRNLDAYREACPGMFLLMERLMLKPCK